MARYVLNSAVITAPGDFSYRLLSVDEAKKWLNEREFMSHVAYEATAEAMGLLLGVAPVVRRMPLTMRVGDEALVFRITSAIGRYERNFRSKQNITPEFVAQHAEIGLLRRTA